MFTDPVPNSSTGGTQITQFDPGTGKLTVVARRTDIEVVGAGVSTCAPSR